MGLPGSFPLRRGSLDTQERPSAFTAETNPVKQPTESPVGGKAPTLRFSSTTGAREGGGRTTCGLLATPAVAAAGTPTEAGATRGLTTLGAAGATGAGGWPRSTLWRDVSIMF